MRDRAQPSALLSSLAHLLDAAGHEPTGNLVVLLRDGPADPSATAPSTVELAIRPLAADRHPCDELHGLVAPPDCWAVAFVVHGRAHVLDALDEPAEPVVSTYLRHRDGRQVSLLRRGSRVTEQRGPVEGRLPDLCRRILIEDPSTAS